MTWRRVTKDWWALDTKSADPWSADAWLKKTNSRAPTRATRVKPPLQSIRTPVCSSTSRRWTRAPRDLDLRSGENLWQNREPKVQPHAQSGTGLAYDPFHKVLVLQSCKKVSQYGGPEDSFTWTYDARTNTWAALQAQSGPGNPWVDAMDFDPEHNVMVVFHARDRSVWAYRLKAVAVGTMVT